MKKIIVTLLAAAFVVVNVSAQEIPERKHDGFRPHASQKMHQKKQLANLNLSEEQKAKVKALNQEQQKKWKSCASRTISR